MPVLPGMTADPMRAQGFRTQRAELPEDLAQPLYDRVNYPTGGVSQMSFFATPIGQSATLITAGSAASKVKNLRDTNMQTSNVVPAKMFKFHGISIGFVHIDNTLSTNVNDRIKIRDGSYLEFTIVDKTILQVPLLLIPESNFISSVATTATATSISAAVGGSGVPYYKLGIPITLNPFENFSVTIKTDGTVLVTGSTDVYLFMHGLMRRPT